MIFGNDIQRLRHRGGQVLVGAIVLLLILAILVPFLVRQTQQESDWTLKGQRTTRAFHVAEAAVEDGYRQMILSSATYQSVLNYVIPSGFNFDQTYTGISGGEYQIRFARLGANSISITGVGRDRDHKEVRAVQATYATAGLGNYSIGAQDTASFGASVDVHWGSVTSLTSIATGGRTYPRFYSTGNVTPQDSNGGTPPNTDSYQWWSFRTDLPPFPSLDFAYYQAAATAAGTSADADCGAYFVNGNKSFKGCQDTTGNVFYITGDCTLQAGSGGNFIEGTLICGNNITVSGNGGSANGVTDVATVPPLAWQEYYYDWATYKVFDPGAPATYAAAEAADYVATGVTYNLTGILVHGFIFAGGAAGLNGGGNGRFHGAVYTPGTATLTTSNFTVYFDNTVAASVHTQGSTPTRTAWREISCGWSGTNASCP
ncbi:MAG: hypothetical protein WC859_02860 [Elusimicrobiota bacterium]|jgi:hypothetical protein